jgi:ribosomal protection tetracycline resistance protein
MRTVNLGILAHVDAGKTTLTERLLYVAGVIGEMGSVDDGSTQTDNLALERQRGITIKSAVVSFVINDLTVNLIDTPGHPDFIAEVERVLSLLDGAVLVVSAVEGVQAQTRVLMRALQRLRIPTLIFVNKIDRGGARPEGVLQDITDRLSSANIAMGSALDDGTRRAGSTPYGPTDVAFMGRLADLLVDHDDAVLTAYVDDERTIAYSQLCEKLAAQTKQALVHPVFFGSAITGAGVDSLIGGISELLPIAEMDVDGPVFGTIFKIERGPAGEKIAYVRMFSGVLRTRDRLAVPGRGQRTVTAISVFERGSAVRSASVAAGQIGKVCGLADIQIGDAIGLSPTTSARHQFALPTLEAVIAPRRHSDKGALHIALTLLAEQDPWINLRQDDIRQELFVSLYGEVQKEVIQATLANDFGIDVGFRETTTICIERPIGTGAAVEVCGKAPNPFLATVGLRVEPAAIDSGLEYGLKVELGSLPLSYHKAVEETMRDTLRQGVYGWQVTDCTVTMTHSGYVPGSSAGDFRNLTPLVLMSALKLASTTVCEPIQRFHLEFPADTLGPILLVLARLEAVPQTPALRNSWATLEGEIPAARVHNLQQQLRTLTRGEGTLECAFTHYKAVRGTIPTRPRSDRNPLNRKEYLVQVERRVNRTAISGMDFDPPRERHQKVGGR